MRQNGIEGPDLAESAVRGDLHHPSVAENFQLRNARLEAVLLRIRTHSQRRPRPFGWLITFTLLGYLFGSNGHQTQGIIAGLFGGALLGCGFSMLRAHGTFSRLELLLVVFLLFLIWTMFAAKNPFSFGL